MRFRLALGALMLMTAMPCVAQTVVPEGQESEAFGAGQDGTLIHKASGFSYPVSLGDMPRRKKILYAADDVSVQYTLRGGGYGDAWIDLFVYPAGRPVEAEALAVENRLISNLKATRLASSPPVPQQATGAVSGWFQGQINGRNLSSGYVIVRRGPWYILARASNPEEAGKTGMKRIAAALATLDWNWGADAASVKP